MNGWQIKPLGWLLLAILILGVCYGSYRAIIYFQDRKALPEA